MTARPPVELLGRRDPWDGVDAVVVGFGPEGFAAADNLTHLGARVVVIDEEPLEGPGERSEKAELLGVLGADVRLGPGVASELPAGAGLLVVTTTGSSPLSREAHERGLPVWSDIELAWRLRDPDHPAPWLCVTGAEGGQRTARLLQLMLRAQGEECIAVGDLGRPAVEVMMDPAPRDVVVVELSAYQLRYTASLAAESAAVLSAGGQAHAPELGRVYERVERACVYNVADPATEQLVRGADVQEGARAIGFTLGMPEIGMLGLVEDILADRAFVEERRTSAAELGTLTDLGSTEPEVVADALAAAALARAHGVSPAAVREGLQAYRP